ncbi:hypothetical protein [Lactiplantibacillus plantarum]|uniref:hypothetical protein n=1 Tax=Lactiplantibacillus plantarum TaxID=1590 RepID=UPI0009774E0C|nr:hypothetical protein [Lactiplantibacillus plantarum]
MDNERIILNFEDNIEDVKALFEGAKRDKHEITTDRLELLDNYNVEIITGLEAIAGPIDVVKYHGKQVSLLGYLEDLLQGQLDSFLLKVLNIKITNYQRYVKTHAEHALIVLDNRSKQPIEMRRAFHKIKGLKQVLHVIWSEALINPMQYKPTKATDFGVVQPLAISRIYEGLNPRTRINLNEKKLKNIINLLIVAGELERLSFDSMNNDQQDWLTRHYPDLYKCPTFYLCFNDLECAYWERISNLSEKTVVTTDAVRMVYGDEVADKMLPVTGQPNLERLELTRGQVDKMTKLLTSQEVTTYDELVASLPDFGVLHNVGPAIGESNLKRHLNSFEALGYFEGLGVETMTASKARAKGYNVPAELNGRSKVYVH